MNDCLLVFGRFIHHTEMFVSILYHNMLKKAIPLQILGRIHMPINTFISQCPPHSPSGVPPLHAGPLPRAGWGRGPRSPAGRPPPPAPRRPSAPRGPGYPIYCNFFFIFCFDFVTYFVNVREKLIASLGGCVFINAKQMSLFMYCLSTKLLNLRQLTLAIVGLCFYSSVTSVFTHGAT